MGVIVSIKKYYKSSQKGEHLPDAHHAITLCGYGKQNSVVEVVKPMTGFWFAHER
jgi:hypothetical protein